MINENIKNNHIIDLYNRYPDENTPITFDKEGSVLSRFKDDIWDLSAVQLGYCYTNILDFTEEKTGLNSDTMYHIKLIMYYELFCAIKRKDTISFRTLIAKHNRYKFIAKFFQGSKSSFLNIRKNGISQKEFLSYLSLNKQLTIKYYIIAAHTINAVGAFFGVEGFGFDDELIHKMSRLSEKAVAAVKQTILIPSRIYSEFIRSGLDVFDKFNNSLDLLRDVFLNGHYLSLSYSTKKHPHLFMRFIKKHHLEQFANDFNIKTGSAFVDRIVQIQDIGFMLVACFSGMRKSEILALGMDCLDVKRIQDKEIYTLNSYTSKTEVRGLKRTTWITSSLIAPVINSLKEIVVMGKAYQNQVGFYLNTNIDKYSLFTHVFFDKESDELAGDHPLFDCPPMLVNSIDRSVKQLIKNIDFRPEDLEELTKFNPLINWCEEYNLEIGKNWKFRPHQFRRSLVVYGIRSGMIQLTVLKKQLQHLSLNMTAYYGNYRGSSNNLFDEKLINEFREENIRYQFVQYEEKILDTNDVLFGGEGTRLHISKRSENAPEYLVNKEKTLQYFEEGRLSYKKTPLGGCARQGSCNRLGFSYITACIDCKDSIFDSSSKVALNKTKQAYQERLMKYEQNSITYKQLVIEINSIDKILNKIEMLEVSNV
ncbi:hypothetical protein IC763_12030 [Acinetobacter seifertii]|nr:hypothetical protein [Acinetobacter seifertii]QNX28941.1 hypothetical protein IC790_10460 [Acinetobacter seifertii]QNY26251.1 hypothetical protein IC763_12030 [Acinetobacter seifertii]